MGRVQALIFVALAVALSSGTASADNVEPCNPYRGCSVTLTFYGTVTSGTDDLGLFGTQGTDLTGQSATLAFPFFQDDFPTEIFDMDGTATISGHSWGFSSVDGGGVNLYGNSVSAMGVAFDNSGPWYVGTGIDASVSSNVNMFVPPQDVATNWGEANYMTRSFSYVLQPGDSGTANLGEATFPVDVCSGEASCVMEENIQVSIHRVRLDVGHAAVPEPATGMMVLIALSGIILLRRQQEGGFPFRSH